MQTKPLYSSPRPRALGRGQRRRAPVTVGAFLISAAVLASATVAPTVASAAPLNETEPNDSSLSANGPIPADGFLSTVGVADDVDYFRLRLQGRRQIRLTISRVSGCRAVGGGGTSASLVAQDGTTVFDFSSFTSTTEPIVKTWTTPRDPTEYLGRITADRYAGTGCQTLVTVAPASAVIVGPLPTPDYGRTLTMAAPTIVAKSTPVPVAVTGVAADEDQVAVQWRTGGCPATPEGNSDAVTRSSLLAAGPFSLSIPTTSPAERSTATLCAWLIDSLGKLTPLVRQQTVAVDPPPPIVIQPQGEPPVVIKARFKSHTRLHRGRAVTVRITGATGKLQFRFARSGKTVRKATVTIRKGKASASTRKLKPGRYRVSVWIGTTRLSALTIRVVK